MKKIELVAPGGSLEKMEYAYHFGADAVYIGLPDFSLRARINEFTPAKIRKAVQSAHRLNKKIYFTLNIFAHERHLAKIKKHLEFIKKAKPDAIIVSDPGIVSLAKKIAPKVKIHLSTQANTTNSEAVKFWAGLGVSRIILAREVMLPEIKRIKKACPKMELEYFVHGAMCVSYSGRCLLSRWMKSRSANLGDCVQSCRWPYKIKNEKFKMKKFGVPQSGTDISNNSEEIIIKEDKHGTYLLNSKDICLIEYLDELAKAGINAFKIEGRTKSAYYVACVAKAYRQVLDAVNSGKSKAEIKKISAEEKKELVKLVNRGYSTGFLFGKDKWENDFGRSHKENEWQFVGEALASDKKINRVKVHNALLLGEKIEVVTSENIFADKVRELRNINGEKVKSAHGGAKNLYFLELSRIYPKKSLLRKRSSARNS
jgi:putative protease